MLAQYERAYAMIMLLRIGDEVGYRVTTWAENPDDARVLGYFTKLRAAAKAGYDHFLAGHSSPGARGVYKEVAAYGRSNKN